MGEKARYLVEACDRNINFRCNCLKLLGGQIPELPLELSEFLDDQIDSP